MATTPSGNGYWLVAADGGIFAYGDAVFVGSSAGVPLGTDVVGLATTGDGRGEQAQGHPEGKEVADPAEQIVLGQVSDVAVQVDRIGAEHPADMGMPETAEHAATAEGESNAELIAAHWPMFFTAISLRTKASTRAAISPACVRR